MQTNRFKLPAYQVWLNHACLLACLGTAFLLYSWPALFAEYRLPLHAHQVLSALLWINALVLLLSMAATRLKFTTSHVRHVCLGIMSGSALIVAGLNFTLSWQIFDNNLSLYSGVFGLLLPTITLALMGAQLLREEKSKSDHETTPVLDENTNFNTEHGDEQSGIAREIFQLANDFAPLIFIYFVKFIIVISVLSLELSISISIHNFISSTILTSDHNAAIHELLSFIASESPTLYREIVSEFAPRSAAIIITYSILLIFIAPATIVITNRHESKTTKRENNALTEDEIAWKDDQIRSYKEWIDQHPGSNFKWAIGITSIIATVVITVSIYYALLYTKGIISHFHHNTNEINYINDDLIIIASCFILFFITMPLIYYIDHTLPGFKKIFIDKVRVELRSYTSPTEVRLRRALLKEMKEGRVSTDTPLAPETLHKLYLDGSIRQISRLFKWVIPAFVVACVIDIFWYRVWYEDHVTVSPVWTWQTYDFAYADALSAEALCRVVKDDGDLEVRATFTLTFPDDARLGLNNAQVRNRLPVVLAVQDALIAAEVPIVQRLDEERAPCQSTLIEDWGEEKGAATWTALFEPRP